MKELNLDGNPLADSKIKKMLARKGKGLKELWKYIPKMRPQKKSKKKKSSNVEEEAQKDEAAAGIKLAQQLAAAKIETNTEEDDLDLDFDDL